MVRWVSMDEGICRIGNWRAAGGWPLRLGRTVELLAGVAPREVEACQAIEERKVGPRSYLVERPEGLARGREQLVGCGGGEGDLLALVCEPWESAGGVICAVDLVGRAVGLL